MSFEIQTILIAIIIYVHSQEDNRIQVNVSCVCVHLPGYYYNYTQVINVICCNDYYVFVGTRSAGDLPAVPPLAGHGAQVPLVQTKKLLHSQENFAHCKSNRDTYTSSILCTMTFDLYRCSLLCSW